MNENEKQKLMLWSTTYHTRFVIKFCFSLHENILVYSQVFLMNCFDNRKVNPFLNFKIKLVQESPHLFFRIN